MSVNGKLWCPPDIHVNLEPPLPPRPVAMVPVAAFITNSGDEMVTVTAGNPQSVHLWEVRDAAGKIVDQRVAITLYDPVSTRIEPGDMLRGDNTLVLSASRLADGERYAVTYHFWGIDCSNSFTVHLAC